MLSSTRIPARSLLAPVALALLLALAAPASAQEKREPEGTPLPPYARQLDLPDHGAPRVAFPENGLPNVLMTGYWPPTNEMLRQFSTNPAQNPDGWVGGDWEGRGFNVYSYFPEFPHGLGKGEGDFEVDYQDTSNDFWPLVEQLQPIAIISYGRADADLDWEVEGGCQMVALNSWYADYLTPYRPTSDLPIANEPVGTWRASSLPMQEIVAAVQASGANVNPYYTSGDDSRFLCHFIGYHVNWYHELHADPADPAWVVCSGFLHIGSNMTLEDAILASEVTLRTVLDHVAAQLGTPGDLNCDGSVDFGDINPFVLALSDPVGYAATYPDCDAQNGDVNGDGELNFGDINAFVALLSGS